jgi:pimeloyl-ACP methyl ester carboxylesterase
VRTVLHRLAAALLAAGGLALLAAAGAQAQIAWGQCGESNEVGCYHLAVPLDPANPGAGTTTLDLRRHRAPVGDARTAIIALAGGPGQPAIPFTSDFAELLGPIAATRDLIVFDQRGIGLSSPLSCHAFERPDLFHSFATMLATCASQLGPNRSYYRTADTVADIEAIRQAAGYEKLVLYGTSYGTKVAELYAQEYPSHVEALVLDSVVPPNGPDTLSRATFAAVPRILRQICAARACAHITPEPVADLAHVVASTSRGPLRGRAIDGEGKAHEVSISSGDLLELFLAGDFSPTLRAELLTADAAAARGDAAPLARLLRTTSESEAETEDFDSPLYYATTCEEERFPWNPASDPGARIAQAKKAALALPASTFAPFTASNALELGDIEGCAHWPSVAPAPALDEAPFPNVPTLILSGADDLRTPTANAREVAAQIPDSHLLVVPDTGHSVLTDEPTSCAREALLALLAPAKIKPCASASLPSSWRPPPLPPLGLAQIAPAYGAHGLPGRTLHALALTLTDTLRQLTLQMGSDEASESLLIPTVRVGGLRAGWAEYENGTLSFHDDTYVPGVTVSGTIKLESADIRVAGAGDAHGTLKMSADHALVGTLGGSHVVLPASSRGSAAIVGVDAQESSQVADGGPAAGAGARKLSGLLRWVVQP